MQQSHAGTAAAATAAAAAAAGVYTAAATAHLNICLEYSWLSLGLLLPS